MNDNCLNRDKFILGKDESTLAYILDDYNRYITHDIFNNMLYKGIICQWYETLNYKKNIIKFKFNSILTYYKFIKYATNLFYNSSILISRKKYHDNLSYKNFIENYIPLGMEDGFVIYKFYNNDINLTLLKIKYPDCVVIS